MVFFPQKTLLTSVMNYPGYSCYPPEMPQRNPVRLIRSLLVPQPPAEADALTWITGAPEVIRNARKNRGSNQGEKKEVKVVL